MSALPLPGSIPGLLRRGSPVILPRGRSMTLHAFTEAGGAWGAVGDAFAVGLVDGAEVEGLALDLTDATGRAHAAWWLAVQRLPDGTTDTARTACVAESWWAYTPEERPGPEGEGAWWPAGWWLGDRFFPLEPFDDRCCVPALASLDPDDPRTLPDGSRWVDAEALRLVCLHVAGLDG